MTTIDEEPVFTDNHRRVLGHLSHPRTLASLVRVIDADLGAPELGIGSMDRVDALLEQCVDAGWAKNVGDLRKAKELHTVPNADADCIDIPRESADLLRARARTARGSRLMLDAGDKFILTKAGLATLTAPVLNEPPPLTGPPLLDALRHNVRLAEEAVEMERACEEHTQEQLDAALEVLASQQAALEAYTDEEDDEEDE